MTIIEAASRVWQFLFSIYDFIRGALDEDLSPEDEQDMVVW